MVESNISVGGKNVPVPWSAEASYYYFCIGYTLSPIWLDIPEVIEVLVVFIH